MALILMLMGANRQLSSSSASSSSVAINRESALIVQRADGPTNQNDGSQSASSSSSSSFVNSIIIQNNVKQSPTAQTNHLNHSSEPSLSILKQPIDPSKQIQTTLSNAIPSSSQFKTKPLLSTASTSVSGSSSGETVIEAKSMSENTTTFANYCELYNNNNQPEVDASAKESCNQINGPMSGCANKEAKAHRKNNCCKHARLKNNNNIAQVSASDDVNDKTKIEDCREVRDGQINLTKCDVGIQVDRFVIDDLDSRTCETSAEVQSNGSGPKTTTSKRHNRFSSNLIRSINRLNPFAGSAASSNQHNNSGQNGDTSFDQQSEIHLAWYQMFAQRYLRRKSTGGRHHNHHDNSQEKDPDQLQVIPITVQSAPTTPVKWVEASTSNGNLKSNSSLRAAPANDTDPATKSDELKQSSSSSTNQTTAINCGDSAVRSITTTTGSRPSVRFADQAQVRGVSTSKTNSRRVTSISEEEQQPLNDTRGEDDDDDDEHDELGELEEDGLDEVAEEDALDEEDAAGSAKASEIVEKLFQFPDDVNATGSVSARATKESATDAPATATKDGGECPMDSGHFRHYGYRLIDYVCNYLDTIRDRRVTPLNIEPGYLKSLIEPAAPETGEPFPKIMQDFEKHIMCGITHWQHPHFHAYFPAGNAYPSILADMLSDALGCVGFSWAASPAYTELEIIMLDWMGKMIGLPDEFLCLSGSQESRGGGVIQGSASECVLVNLLAARHWAIERLRSKYPRLPDGVLLSKLIGYCSKEAHSCVEKAAMIGFISMRALDTDENQSLRGETLAKAIEADLEQGLEPFLVCATLGTTSCVSFDNLDELGTVCEKHNIWLHVDAAYAGSALICPEFKYLMRGIEKATSFNMNPNKWMLINFDCSLMWVKDRFKLTRAFVVDPLYLQHSYSDQAIDYRHWGIPLSRRFRALKLWFVIRNYGISGLQAYVRNHVRLAKLFESLLQADQRFAVTNRVVLGLVCFRLIGSNGLNQRLLSIINASGKLHMVPASVNGRYVIRFCICDQNAKDEDVRYAYQCISDFATELITSVRASKEKFRAISAQNTVEMLASAPPIGVQSDNEQMTDDTERSASRTPLSRPSSRLSQRSVSMDSSRAVTPNIGNPDSHPLVGTQASSSNSSASSSARSNGRLGVAGQGAALCKSPLTKQRSVLANDGEQPESEDEFVEQHSNNRTADRSSDSVGPTGANLSPGPPTGSTDQQQDSEQQLRSAQQRRARVTSGRYKRRFFVRVVSDPRVYRASISGDINAHSSNGSLSGSACGANLGLSNGSQISSDSNSSATVAKQTMANQTTDD